MIPRLFALGLLMLPGQQSTGWAAGPDVLRARSHLLRSSRELQGPEASADTRYGRLVPQAARITPEQSIIFRRAQDSAGQQSTDHIAEPEGRRVPRIDRPARTSRPRLPVLTFPEPGLDDTAAYQGYQTRFYRDSKSNTVQIYLEPSGGRAVLVWADAANESVGFTARDNQGRPARLTWTTDTAEVTDSGSSRTIEYGVTASGSRLHLGWFLLGSMRVERDFVYARHHLKPFSAQPFYVAEESLLVATIERLPPQERSRHLALLKASVVPDLRARLHPTIVVALVDSMATVRVERPSLDGRNRLVLELRVNPRTTSVRAGKRTVSFFSAKSPVQFSVRVTTDAAPLTPLSRGEIFNREFLDFLSSAGGARDSAASGRHRRLDRQVRGVELLSSKEKLMAGLPNFATYFGRDMMMTALMMGPIWSPGMAEHVIASVLRKLGPRGDVSHEEALGGQAIRENAVVYDSLLTEYFRAARRGLRQAGDSTLGRAREILRDLQKTRENYHMIDDEFQLPVLEARYLADPAVSRERKRAFLLEKADTGASRLVLMLREMALVVTKTRDYTQRPVATNLVGFPKLDATHWRSSSWRDSNAGYAGGRFAMDINAIWAPNALEAIAAILASLPTLGFTPRALDSIAPEIGRTPLGEYLRDSTSLRRAIDVWRRARQHFEVTLQPGEIRQQTGAKLARLPPAERRHWLKVMADQAAVRDSLTFLVLSLDAGGRPIPVVNTDPATELFLDGAGEPERVLRDVAAFMRPYPVGLFVEGLGPLVANDAYSPPHIWDRFRADPYHGPRVVWGREVNLFFLGLANQISGALDANGRSKNPALSPYVKGLDDALRHMLDAVHASGLQHNELWSYQIKDGRFQPIRYGTSSDVQLWNTTNLVVQFALSRLPNP
jgi:hypothetical protein